MMKCGRGKRAGKQKGASSHTTVCIDYANGLCAIKRSKCKYQHVVFSSPLESDQCDSYVLTGKCTHGEQCTHYHPFRTGLMSSQSSDLDKTICLCSCSVDQALLLVVQHLQDTHLPPTSAVQWILAQAVVHPLQCAQITHHLCELVPHHCSRTVANLILDGVGSCLFHSNAETRKANFVFLEEFACEEWQRRSTCLLLPAH